MEKTSSIFSYNPLFSSIITLYILIFLYFPCNSLKLIVSPILISTLILLLSLLRLGTSQQTLVQQQQQSHANIVKPEPEPEPEPCELEPEPEPEPMHVHVPEPESESESESEPEFSEATLTLANLTKIEPKPEPKHKPEPSLKSGLSQEEEKVETHCDRTKIQPINNLGLEPETKQFINNTDITNKEDKQTQPDPVTDPFSSSTEIFVGWAVCAPLEVIYESYEGEEDVEMYAELGSGLGSDTDTDTGSSSTWEEEEKEGMFEIALDHEYGDDYYNKCVLDMKKLKNEFEVDEEDNLIEIDISF